LEKYKKQYSKTYLEDFDNIYNIALKRLKKIITKLEDKANIKKISLLDIGSAMGFFLKAARDTGIDSIKGVEISNFAAEYCTNEFNIDVINSSFMETNLEKSYDIITAWFFIEHCEHPSQVIKKIYHILNHNGIFAFSVPSIFGPLFLFNRSNWINNHPVDHKIDFSPFSVKKYLKKIGFRKIKTSPGGIHPERVLSQNSLFYKPFKVLYPLLSRAISFSDTIEVIAIK